MADKPSSELSDTEMLDHMVKMYLGGLQHLKNPIDEALMGAIGGITVTITNSGMFYDTARRNLLIAEGFETQRYAEMGTLEEVDPDAFFAVVKNVERISEPIAGLSAAAIILCAASLEAFIFEWAADRRSIHWVNKHLNSLDLYSRWVVIPELITKTEIDTSQKLFQELRWIVITRNRLIHSKKKVKKLSDVTQSDLLGVIDAKRAIATVRLAAETLHSLDASTAIEWLSDSPITTAP